MKSITSSIVISVLLAYAVLLRPPRQYKRNSDIDDHLVYKRDNVGGPNHYYDYMSPDQSEKRSSDIDNHLVYKRDNVGGPNHYYDYVSPDQAEKRSSDIDNHLVYKRDNVGGPNHYYDYVSPDQAEKRNSGVDGGVHKREEKKFCIIPSIFGLSIGGSLSSEWCARRGSTHLQTVLCKSTSASNPPLV
ncbi:hypothetical protein FIBSPDRAFT_899767 [Athelia psychrophila]|uniref:Uncharacterized protein n=1 Tax=Athelia psychrophila TaxID=1759441 RepID=A0A165ZC69_9AGAM|nr:hypothetical protein FIBSPDRAFT_899767 [Fibularhizoctonia sp. CBS 109695]